MQELVEKAGVLIEALPYIKKFRGKEVLIKYGGAALVHDATRDHVLQDLVFMQYVGIKPILIHGGGKHITENLQKRGIETKFVQGLRVTDRKTIDTVVDTLADINSEIVDDLQKFGAHAVGLSGHDARILKAKKHTEHGDVGFVGDVVSVNTKTLKDLTEASVIPVIYPLGFDDEGNTYNINADEAASKIAAAMGVQKIMLLTNVLGIMRDAAKEDSLISSLHVSEVESLINEKVIAGGMIPKVKAAIKALQGGVKKAHIIDGRTEHSLLLEIFTDKGIGTEIIL